MKHFVVLLLAGFLLAPFTPTIPTPTPEDEAIVALRKLEGTVIRDLTRPGHPVVEVNL